MCTKEIPVLWLSYRDQTPAKGYWDQGLLMKLFSGGVWKSANGFSFKEYFSFADLPLGGAIIVLPASVHNTLEYIDKLNEDMKCLQWVLLILGEDEGGVFRVELVNHPNIKIWVMNPRVGKHDRFSSIGNYWPTDTQSIITDHKHEYDNKLHDWFFAGQVNHSRRKDCVNELRKLQNGYLVETGGFTQGLDRKDYIKNIVASKVVPCPSGVLTPDSFRLFETLEAGSIPVADVQSPRSDYLPGYWELLFGADNVKFPTLSNWSEFPAILGSLLSDWAHKSNEIYSWWQGEKRNLTLRLENDILYISGIARSRSMQNTISVIIPTSPISIHPDTSCLEYTIKSIRDQPELVDCEIVIMFDGVRKAQQHYYANYQEYIRQVLWKCNFEWKNVLPVVFSEHSHQVKMTRDTLEKSIKTPYILFVEHDTPIANYIPFREIVDSMKENKFDLVRLLHESEILACHQHLMLDNEPKDFSGVPLVRTIQWSQRPHIANVEFYKGILKNYFTQNARSMIEDKMHGIVQSFPSRFTIAIYAPPGDKKRSYHTDTRGYDSKFESEMIF